MIRWKKTPVTLNLKSIEALVLEVLLSLSGHNEVVLWPDVVVLSTGHIPATSVKPVCPIRSQCWGIPAG